MKRTSHLRFSAAAVCLVLLLPTLFSCREEPLSSVLRQLDKDIENRKEYRDSFLRQVSPQHACLQNAENDSLRFIYARQLLSDSRDRLTPDDAARMVQEAR